MIVLLLAFLAVMITALSLWRRSIIFSIAAGANWLALGVLVGITPAILGAYTLADDWLLVLVILFFAMSAGCLLYYIGGIGKVKLMKKNKSGEMWEVFTKPPMEEVETRSRRVKSKRKEKLRSLRRAK